MTLSQIQEDVLKLKKENDVMILAHYYQPMEIQDIADFLGDSLGLSRIAKEKANAEKILFAGVDFMAETASILNQDKKIYMPSHEACCPMAAFLTAEMVIKFKEDHPGLPVVTYVNSTASVKAESDICCTSSNAVKIVQKISEEFGVDAVLFGPDSNLADYAEQKCGIKTIKMPEEGHCYVHSQVKAEHVIASRKAHPNAKILVHPECKREVRELADIVGSTAHMINHVKDNSKDNEFLIGTEKGLLERMARDYPDKNFYLIIDKLICYNMKKNTIELTKHVLEHLDDEMFEVRVPPEIARRALAPINKMLEFS